MNSTLNFTKNDILIPNNPNWSGWILVLIAIILGILYTNQIN